MNIRDLPPIGNSGPFPVGEIPSENNRVHNIGPSIITNSISQVPPQNTHSVSTIDSSNPRIQDALSVTDARQLSSEFTNELLLMNKTSVERESSNKFHVQTEKSEVEQKSLNNSQDALSFLDQEFSEPNEKNVNQSPELQAKGEKSEIEQKALNNAIEVSNFLDQELSDSNEKDADNVIPQISNSSQNSPNSVEQRSLENVQDASSFLDQLEQPVDNDSFPNVANNFQLPESDLKQQEQVKAELLKRDAINTNSNSHIDTSHLNKTAAIDKTQVVTSFGNIPLSKILLAHPSNLKDAEKGKRVLNFITAEQAHKCPHPIGEMVAVGAEDEAGNFRFDPSIHSIIQGRIAAGLTAPINLNGKRLDFASTHKHLLGKALSNDEIGSLQIIARDHIAKLLQEKLATEKKIEEDAASQRKHELNGSAKGQWSKETEEFVKVLISTIPLTIASNTARKLRHTYETAVAKKAEQEKRTQRIFKERADKTQRKKDEQIKQENLTKSNLQYALQAERNKLNGDKNTKVIGLGEYTSGDVVVRTTLVATQMAKQSFSTTFKSSRRA